MFLVSNSSTWRSWLHFPWRSWSQRHRDGPAEVPVSGFSWTGGEFPPLPLAVVQVAGHCCSNVYATKIILSFSLFSSVLQFFSSTSEILHLHSNLCIITPNPHHTKPVQWNIGVFFSLHFPFSTGKWTFTQDWEWTASNPSSFPFLFHPSTNNCALKTLPMEWQQPPRQLCVQCFCWGRVFWCDCGSYHQHFTNYCVLCPLNWAGQNLLLWIQLKLHWILLFCSSWAQRCSEVLKFSG